MMKNLALLLILCLTAISAWAGTTKDAVEKLNRSLPVDAGTDRVLGKIVYDELNQIVVANYLTTWKNLVLMRKTPDFEKKAASDVLRLILVQDTNIQPFTLVINYFANEPGFEDLAKTYFVSPGQVANVLKAVQNVNKNNHKEQPIAQRPTSSTTQQPKPDQDLQTLSSRLAEFKGSADPQGRFTIARYSLSPDNKDINIVILAKEEALPFFVDNQYAPTLENSMSTRLAKQYPDLENIFNNKDLSVVIYVADTKGNIKGQHKFPASNVFSKARQATTDAASTKGKDGKVDKQGDGKDKSKPQTASQGQPVVQEPSSASTQPQTSAQQPSQSQTSTQTQVPTKQTVQGSGQDGQTTTSEKGSNESGFQAMIKLYQAMLPQQIAEGIKLTQIKANQEMVVIIVDVDGEKYAETSVDQIREVLIKHLVSELGKKKSVLPLLITLSCQTSRKYVYLLSSKNWSSTYPVPMDPCSIIQTLKDKVAKGTK